MPLTNMRKNQNDDQQYTTICKYNKLSNLKTRVNKVSNIVSTKQVNTLRIEIENKTPV